MVSATAFWIDAGSSTSSFRQTTLGRAAKPRAFSGERRGAATFQPFFWNSAAAALPMPLDAPVMSTVLFIVSSFGAVGLPFLVNPALIEEIINDPGSRGKAPGGCQGTGNILTWSGNA